MTARPTAPRPKTATELLRSTLMLAWVTYEYDIKQKMVYTLLSRDKYRAKNMQ